MPGWQAAAMAVVALSLASFVLPILEITLSLRALETELCDIEAPSR